MAVVETRDWTRVIRNTTVASCAAGKAYGLIPRGAVALAGDRIAWVGKRPAPPPRLSSMFFAWLVEGVTTVTAGWLMTYLMKNCAHVFASNSAAHSGNGRSPTRRNRLVRPKGR